MVNYLTSKDKHLFEFRQYYLLFLFNLMSESFMFINISIRKEGKQIKLSPLFYFDKFIELKILY